MNFLKIPMLAPLLGVKAIKDIAPGTFGRLVATGIAAVAVPAMVIGIGMLVGANGSEDAGQTVIRIGAVAGILLAIWVAIRLAVPLHIVAFGSSVAKAALGEWAAVVDQASARSFMRVLCGGLAFLSSVYLAAMHVPIWRDPSLAMIPFVSALILALGASAAWFGGRSAKIVITVYATAMLVGSLLAYVPGVSTIVGAFTERHLGGMAASSDREGKVDAVSNESQKALGTIDKDFLEAKLVRLAVLRQTAIKDCGGHYCSTSDRDEAMQIQRDEKAIKEGTYWKSLDAMDDSVANAPPPATTQEHAVLDAETAAGSTNADDSVANLPPPSPDAAVTETATAELKKPKTVKSLDEQINDHYGDL